MKLKKILFTNLLSLLLILVLSISCHKSKNDNTGADNGKTNGGLSYKLFINTNNTVYKGILVMGSGNDENNPGPGDLNDGSGNALCQKAADNGYVAVQLQYRKGVGGVDKWDENAAQLATDYDDCIQTLAAKYNIDIRNSVVGGYSYASFMLFSINANLSTLRYCKGILGACGGTSDNIANFKIPVFAINCSGNNEGDNTPTNGYYGKGLYDQIPAGAIKNQSAGITDNSCNTHCGGNWTDQMYTQLSKWLP